MRTAAILGQAAPLTSNPVDARLFLHDASSGRNTQESLSEYIRARLTTRFQWGSHDCVCFAIGWLSIKAGKDLLAPFRPWHDETSARLAIERAGGLEKQFDLHLKRLHPDMAGDGDITVIENTTYLFSDGYIVGPGKDGLVFINRKEARQAWTL